MTEAPLLLIVEDDAPLRDRLASVTVVPIPGHEFHGLSGFSQVQGAPAPYGATDVAEALRKIEPTQGEIVLIAGSLYLAGVVLRENGEIPH